MDTNDSAPSASNADAAADAVNADGSGAFAVAASRRVDLDANPWDTTAAAEPAAEGRVFGYARHRDPDVLASQIQELVRLGVPPAHVYTDQASSTGELPGLDAVLTSLQQGDRLVVTTTDRLARVGVAMADVFARIDAAGAVFCPQGIPAPPEV